MLKLGKFQFLTAGRVSNHGIYLRSDDGGGEVLLPNKLKPDGLVTGGRIEVFVYNDSEDRLVATTRRPLLELGQYATLRAVDTNRIGAFFDWGLEKDLLVPFREQSRPIEEGEWHVVHLFLDQHTERLVGTTRISRTLSTIGIQVAEGEPVAVLPYHTSDLGINVIVENRYAGLIFHNEAHQQVEIGRELKGYVKAIRADGKLDISLRPPGRQAVLDSSDVIMEAIRANGGHLPLNDKSPPELISQQLGVSKKVFKQAIGKLYRERRIVIEDDGVRLLG